MSDTSITFEYGAQRLAVKRQPVDHVVIDGVFGADASRRLLADAAALRPHFRPGGIGAGAEAAPDLRRSLICAPDEVFHDPEPPADFRALLRRRAERSSLLSAIDSLLVSHELRDLFDAAPFPLCKLREVNRWETQLAWYGEGHKYNWHLDRLGDDGRVLSIVYFLFEEPRRFGGGELELTDALARDGALASTGETARIALVNDRAVVFGARAVHRVRPVVDAPEEFAAGRFSITVFCGIHGGAPADRVY